ncbi:hypothetical protein CR513_04214, partial [Mucuna pruriens]
MCNAFRAKKKGFIDGKISKSTNDSSKLKEWLAANDRNHGDQGTSLILENMVMEPMIVFKLLDTHIGGTQGKNGRGRGRGNHGTQQRHRPR